ncbi:MAG: replication-associated recombination protein A [Bacteriovoracia bacterium]
MEQFTFDNVERNAKKPLAEQVRPNTIDGFIGQKKLLGANSAVQKAILEDRVRSMILWGPPGSGKTTLARIVASYTKSEFVTLSAVHSGVKDIKEAIIDAQRRQARGQKTIVFVDEIHRFNKSQQDALLPYVEDGTITLIGATTENPSFEINSALLSRAPVYRLEALAVEDLSEILNRAALHLRSQNPTIVISEDEIREIAEAAKGDARFALNQLELYFDASVMGASFQKPGLRLKYDKSGEEHYNTISAFIKSMRDSDPDAALFYMAKMLVGGEDPLFIARRMVIFASEDIGNADPRAISVALAVKDAVDFVGMPEARISLAQGVTYLSCAPKSNASYTGIEKALKDAESENAEVPMHLRNAPTQMMKTFGYSKGYQYAHNNQSQTGLMTNLPEGLKDRIYYEPKDSGLEKQISEKLKWIRDQRYTKADKKGHKD